MNPSDPTRPIRSFVRRNGRTTQAQARALAELWPRYGIEMPACHDLDQVFARRVPRMLEIGFGTGEALAAMAAARPQLDFVGIDVHEPGIGHALRLLNGRDLHNVRVVRGDAVELLRDHLPAHSLGELGMVFPDPWPKKRHHKRRLIQPAFLALCHDALIDGGVLHLATDWTPYAEWMLDALAATPGLENRYAAGPYAPDRGTRPATRFERRGARLGHAIHDLVFIKRAPSG